MEGEVLDCCYAIRETDLGEGLVEGPFFKFTHVSRWWPDISTGCESNGMMRT